jgi:sugar phosphate isomerase/epimerase
MDWHELPFRVGTTSYIIPDDILPNVRYLAGQVQDIELVLFELDDGLSNLPSRAQIAELRALAAENDLTYTVHLPLDLRLADDGSTQHVSLKKAQRVIDCTLDLDPWAFVLHLDGKTLREPQNADATRRWQDQAVKSLEQVGNWAGSLQRLALENLEGYPPDFHQPVLERLPISRCVDIGHLWVDGRDVLSYLRKALPRTRVIHFHGMDERDHRSLAFMPEDRVGDVLDTLKQSAYTGVLTVEIFSQPDFLSSMDTLRKILFGSRDNE